MVFNVPDQPLGSRCTTVAHPYLQDTSHRTTPTIAVIGAGFSGTLLALHLLRRCPRDVRVYLIEKNSQFGRGLAYSTGNANHLLNVPAGRMSAFSDRPKHFITWLRENGPDEYRHAEETSFIQRSVFGLYVQHLLIAELEIAGKDQLVLTHGGVTGIDTAGPGVALHLEGGKQLRSDIAVLAIGNFPPEAPTIPDPGFYDTRYYRADPWALDTISDLEPHAPVLLIGTGLTMVDMVISLLDQGHTGPILALSRGGLLPHRHATASAAPLFDRPLPTSMPALLRCVRSETTRAEQEGGDWRPVIDGLRPALQEIWQSMTLANRARFLRHLRRWWDIHRHRMPGIVADRIDRARASGQLMIMAARILDFRIDGDRVEVTVAPRFGQGLTCFRVARVINCSGPGCDYSRITDPFVRHLLVEGHVRPDPLHLGLDVTPQCSLLNSRGEISRRLYAVGPVTKSAFWEMTSVPDIRRQCELVAGHVGGLISLLDGQYASRTSVP
jgi:uncharacterized NAD(P)/FAD-binding protein YdhS